MDILTDPKQFIRRAPERFFRHVPPKAYELVQGLAADALLLTGGLVRMRRGSGGWWIVQCDEDWLCVGNKGDPLEVFQRMLPLPEASPNSLRSEVLVAAFARDLVTTAAGGRSVIVGEAFPTDQVWSEMGELGVGRAVAFRL